MLFQQIRKTSNVEPMELKFLCELYLDSIGMEHERLVMTKISNQEKLEEVVGSLETSDIIKYVMECLVKNKSKEGELKTYLMDFFSRHTREDIPYKFVYSNAGRKLIAQCLSKNSAITITDNIVEGVQQLFAKAMRKTYYARFEMSGYLEAYTRNAFNSFFVKNYSREIQIIKDQRTSTVQTSEGPEDLINIKDYSQFDEKEPTYNVPEFKNLVYAIYKGSLELKYSQRGNKEYLPYDIFSHIKYRITMERHKKFLMESEKQVRFSLKEFLELIDINADKMSGPHISPQEPRSRLYRHRGELIDTMLAMDKDRPFKEQFEDILVDGRWDRSLKGNKLSGVFPTGGDELSVNLEKRELQDRFLDIHRAINAALKLVHQLENNNIDPLSVPSEIFRNPDWFAKVDSLESYLKMYDNIKELETQERPVLDGIKSNNELSRVFYGAELDHLKSRLLGDIDLILKGKKTTPNRKISSYVEEQRITILGKINNIAEKYEIAKNIYDSCMHFVDIWEVIPGVEPMRIRLESGGIALDWGKAPANMKYVINNQRNDLLEYYNVLAPSRGLKAKPTNCLEPIMVGLTFMQTQLKEEDNSELFYKTIRFFSTLRFFTERLYTIFAGLDKFPTDMTIIDRVNTHNTFIELSSRFKEFRDLRRTNGGNTIITCLPKNTSLAVVNTVMVGYCRACFEMFKSEFKLLNDISRTISYEEDTFSSKDVFGLGDHEGTLLEYAKLLEYGGAPRVDGKATLDLHDTTRTYKGAYFLEKKTGRPRTRTRYGYTYYLSVKFVWITPELEFDDTLNRQPYAKGDCN